MAQGLGGGDTRWAFTDRWYAYCAVLEVETSGNYCLMTDLRALMTSHHVTLTSSRHSDGEEVASPKADTRDKCGAIRNCDVITLTAKGAGPAGGDVREAAPQLAPAIYLLDHELLKMVLSKMDCWADL